MKKLFDNIEDIYIVGKPENLTELITDIDNGMQTIANDTEQLTDVTAIKMIVADISGFGDRFDSGISCVEDLLRYIMHLIGKNNELSDDLQDNASVLSEKIENTENEISDYESELSNLNNELIDIENEIANTNVTIEKPLSDESTICVPNPEYEILQAQASDLKHRIVVIEGLINSLQNKLNHMCRLQTQLNTLTSRCKENSVKLNEDSSKCRQVIADLTELKANNANKSDEANRLLETICRIIEEYQSLTIQYDDSLAFNPLQKLALETLINLGSVFISKYQNNGVDGNVKKDDNGKDYRKGDELKDINSFVRLGYRYCTV